MSLRMLVPSFAWLSIVLSECRCEGPARACFIRADSGSPRNIPVVYQWTISASWVRNNAGGKRIYRVDASSDSCAHSAPVISGGRDGAPAADGVGIAYTVIRS